MRLNEITIANFKNLRDFTVDFDEESPYTVLVGENGSGKSNLIEALTLVFRNLDLDLPAPFSYQLKYRCRGMELDVHAVESESPVFRARPIGATRYKELPKRRFMGEDSQGRPLFRPAFVFGYYSGPTDRLASLYERHGDRYYRLIIKPQSERTIRPIRSNALRRLFYAQTLHGQFALLAFFMEPAEGQGNDHAFLREHLQIDGLDSVLFALKRPPWPGSKDGDSRFWRAEGEVRDFLSRLYDAAFCPARMKRRIHVDLRRDPLVESLYLFLPGSEALEQVYRSYGSQYAFFTALESTHMSKLLGEVRTRVRMTPGAGGGAVTYRDLSEGEQQLLLVLGLLKFTAEDESLFLLDEPDTHLNPAWSTQYLSFLDHFIQERSSCHIVLSSHDPLVFAGLERSQVRILRRVNGHAVAEEPLQDPRGMGIQAILASDLFRLRAGGLDADTQRDLELQRELSLKKELTTEDADKLREVTDRLTRLGFWNTARDPIYQLFLQKWEARRKPEWEGTVQLSQRQLREREELAAEIAAEIGAERGDAP